MSLVSVPPTGLQPAPDGGSRGQLIAQLQELLHHWVLWSAVKSRWVIVGKCTSTPFPSILQFLTGVRVRGADSPKGHVGIGIPPILQVSKNSETWVGNHTRSEPYLLPVVEEAGPRHLLFIEHLLCASHRAGRYSRALNAWALI